MLLRAVTTIAAPGAIAAMVTGCTTEPKVSGFYGDAAYDGGYEVQPQFDGSTATDGGQTTDAADSGEPGDAGDAGDADTDAGDGG